MAFDVPAKPAIVVHMIDMTEPAPVEYGDLPTRIPAAPPAPGVMRVNPPLRGPLDPMQLVCR